MSSHGPRYAPVAHDAYYTPAWAVEALIDQLPTLPPVARLWEPAAGDGYMARVMAARQGRDVFASDLNRAPSIVHPVSPGLDFLASTGPSGAGPLIIITNPPYGAASRLALAFIVHALKVTHQSAGLVAMLLPFEFDSRAARIDLVANHPAFAFKLTLTRRIRWRNLPQKASGPMGHHAWFVWDWHAGRRAKARAIGSLRAA